MKSWNRCLCSFVCLVMFHSTASAQSKETLFEFDKADEVANWQIVNDGVMGGRSTSKATIIDQGVLRFAGILSLENNGGFASVRSRPDGSLGLASGESIVLRVKGDGRRYTFNLYTPERRTAFSYQLDFDTKAGEWTEVRLPVDKFVAHSYGRPMPSMKLDPNQVHSVGILLGDKKSGPFEILVDWINVD